MKVLALLLALAIIGVVESSDLEIPGGHFPNNAVAPSLVENDREDAPTLCLDEQKVFFDVWKYSMEQMVLRNISCLRLDLMIVASSKTVYHATFYPATGFGVTSSFARLSDGHLAETVTYSNHSVNADVFSNNVCQLYTAGIDGNQIDGTYTMELSHLDEVLLTSCATFSKDDYGAKTSEGCRIWVADKLLEEVKRWLKTNDGEDGENRQGVSPRPRPKPTPMPNPEPMPEPEEEKVTGPPQCFVANSRIHRFVCPAADAEEAKEAAMEAMEAADEARARAEQAALLTEEAKEAKKAIQAADDARAIAKKSAEAKRQAEARARKAEE